MSFENEIFVYVRSDLSLFGKCLWKNFAFLNITSNYKFLSYYEGIATKSVFLCVSDINEKNAFMCIQKYVSKNVFSFSCGLNYSSDIKQIENKKKARTLVFYRNL